MSVEVKLELGHRAVQRERKTAEGFTHDWTVFVRGVEGNNIQYFVEKVVFHLHESFPKPKRVLKEPPYSVQESGYAGFIMPIDVYFRTKEEPRKVTFKYDLYLRLEGPPVSNIRIEKMTYQNPSPEFRSKLIKGGGLAGALSGSAAGGSASLSTQACVPPQNVDEHHQPNPPKQAIAEKKQPKSHVPSKELPSKPPPPPPPKPSQPFTDIFGAPIRTKSSPDSSTVKSKDPGHSSQPKIKAPPSSSSSSAGKEGKPSSKDKESHKSKESHHSKDKDSHQLKESKETAHSSKDPHPPKEPSHPLKEVQPKEPHPPSTKDSSQSSKEGHHPPKEKHLPKEHHSKEGHKSKDSSKDSHHSSKEGKTPKESRPSEPKDSKPSKSIKADKELSKSSTKRVAPTDSHSSHGNVEKKKKFSPISSESSDKCSSQSKHKSKEIKNKAEKHKNKSHSNPLKKEEEKPKHKTSPASHPPPELKESLKPKPNSPFKAPSPALKPPSPPPKPPSPLPVKPLSPIAQKLPSPVKKPPSPFKKTPSPDSTSMDSDSDESHKSYNKALYSSASSSISESSLHESNPILISDHSILSPLSDEDDPSSPVVHKRKSSSGENDHGDVSPDFKSVENKPMPKLKKKQHSSHHKSSFKPKTKHRLSESYHRGNGSINNDISRDRSPRGDHFNSYTNTMSYRQELMQLQQIIMASDNRNLLQHIVDLIEKTGKYEVTNTTFDFDLATLDPAIVQKIKLYLRSM